MTGTSSDWLIWVLMIGALGAFMFLPQWQARRRQEKKLASLAVGDRVLTIGGFKGRLTYFSTEENKALLELAEGVVVEILPGAISRKLEESQPGV